MTFEEITKLTATPEELLASVNKNPSRWQLVIRHVANDASQYARILPENAELLARVQALETANEQLAHARDQIQQNIGEQRIYERNI